MTAFNEVMTAEQEAEQAIQTAKEEVAVAIADAKDARLGQLAATEAKLASVVEAETLKQQAEIDEAVKKIGADAAAKVAAIQQRFATHKAEVVALVTQRLQ